MKKYKLILTIISIIACISMSSAICSADGALNFMNELKVLSGDENGNLNLENSVTRAEFTKMAVMASVNRNTVSSNILISPFGDVDYTSWFAPYVYVGTKAGMIKGYSDGYFRPNQNVTLEEGCSVLLSLLGYTSEDFGTSYPYGQTSMANNLGLTKNVSKSIGDALSRGDVAQMIYNTLNTIPKSKTQKYMNELSYSVIEDEVLIATPQTSETVESGKILITSGTYKCSFIPEDVYLKGDFIVKNGDEIVDFIPKNQKDSNFEIQQILQDKIVAKNLTTGTIVDIDVDTALYNGTEKTTIKSLISNLSEGVIIDTYKNTNNPIEYCSVANEKIGGTKEIQSVDNYVIYQVLDDKVLIATTDNLQMLDISNDTVVYNDTTKTTIKSIKSSLVTGDIIKAFKDSNGKILYLSLDNNSLDGPYTVTNPESYSSYSIIRDGVKSTTVDINDIVYISKELNTIYAYTTKKTGIFESASPNKDNPTSVVISGKTYSIEGLSAFSKLSSRGDIEYGQWVTVCLGRTGKIADVITNDTSESIIGLVTDYGLKTYTDNDNNEYSKSYVVIVDETGEEHEYPTKSSVSSTYKNKIVAVTFENTDAVLNIKQAQSTLSGKVNIKNKTLGSEKLSDDLKIIDIAGHNQAEYSAIYKTLFSSRLDGATLSSTQIIWYEKNDAGEISKLFLNSFSGDMYTYGILTKKSTSSGGDTLSASYTYDVNGVETTVKSSSNYSVGSGAPSQIKVSNGDLFGIVNLKNFTAGLDSITDQTINEGSTVHYMSDNVLTYSKTSSGAYYAITMSELKTGAYKKITAYYDKSYQTGGRIRILVAQ